MKLASKVHALMYAQKGMHLLRDKITTN